MNVEGVNELTRKFAALSGKMQRAVLRDSLRSAARVVEKSARQKVPVDTGRLKKKNITQAVTVQSVIGEAKIGYRKEVFYGRFVELGTSKMSARPFLRPALDENKDEIEKVFVAALNRTIEARSG